MPRWRQTVDPETGKSKFIPIDDAARRESHAIHGDVEAFRSPIDGTVIADRKALREHCEKHNVVPSGEFTPEYYAEKQRERDRHHTGERTREESLQIKREMWETMHRMERQ